MMRGRSLILRLSAGASLVAASGALLLGVSQSKTAMQATPGVSDPAAGASAPKARKTREVGIVVVQPERLELTTELPGRTASPQAAEIRPQASGIVLRRHFDEGDIIHAGQLLYELDASAFQTALAGAQANVQRAESLVAAARVTAQRNAELVRIDAVSRQVHDASAAALQQSEAELGVARAAEQAARVQLGYTRIVSPIGGRAGLSATHTGALVTAGQASALATVHQLDPMVVDLTQSSAEVLRLQREALQQAPAGKPSRAGAEPALRVRLLLEDGTPYAPEGRLALSGVSVNPSTGAVTHRAVFPNPQGRLLPGMYVRALVSAGVQDGALLVPQQAVVRGADGQATALVVGAEDKLSRRTLTVQRAVGNRWLVTQGLQAGERVLVEGSLRAKPGDKVKPVPITALQAQAPVETAVTAMASR